FEQRRRRVGGQHHTGACGRFVEPAAHLGRRRERDREIAAAVAVRRSGATETEDGACRKAAQVARVERRIGGDDEHAGSVGWRSSLARPVLSETFILRQARDARRVEGPVLSETLILRPARDARRVEGPVLSETFVLRPARDARGGEGPVLSETLVLRRAREARRGVGPVRGGAGA